MQLLSFYTLIIFGYLTTCILGGPCPEQTRKHLTRCDMYFRCVVLPSKTHVWVPTKCDRGLIYEPNFRMCVLPADDWECDLEEGPSTPDDDANIFGINTLNGYHLSDQNQMSSVLRDNDNPDFIEVKSVKKNSVNRIVISDKSDNYDVYESSGDGIVDDDRTEAKTEHEEYLKVSKIDPQLTGHLQRLSQLVDGLAKKHNKNTEFNSDLRPDQLNAFLAHYNIKSQLNNINPSDYDKQVTLDNGKIHPEILSHIVQKQKKLNQNLIANVTESNLIRVGVSTTPSSLIISNHSFHNGNFANADSSYSNTNLSNQKKIILKNSIPIKLYRKPNNDDYSNTQIVVNRPGGSVLFKLPDRFNDDYSDNRYEPKISEETLKTVLELSKQMITNQNIRQVFPMNGNFYQPMVQPIYYPYPMPNIDNNSNEQKHVNSKNSENVKVSDDLPGNKHSTIITNTIIPVAITSNNKDEFLERPPTIATEKPTLLNSYGQIATEQSLSAYPPYQSSYPQDYFGAGIKNKVEVTSAKPIQYDQKYDYSNDYYTRNPYFESNINNLYATDRYPALPIANKPSNFQLQISRPDSSPYHEQSFVEKPSYFDVDHNKIFHKQSYNINQYGMFPNKINPSAIKIQPNGMHRPSPMSSADQNDENNFFEYNQFQNNKNPNNSQFVSESLTSNLDELINSNKHTDKNTNLVEIGGTFINYDIYKNQLLPALGHGGESFDDKINFVTCTAGARQPNATDCTRYYVCNPKTGDVLSYSCPPYTAFNTLTRICDAKTFSFCNPSAIQNRFTVLENRRIQLEALKALQDAKRIRDEAIKSQNIANRIRLETQQIINSSLVNPNQMFQEPELLMNYGEPAMTQAQNNMVLMTTSTTSMPFLGLIQKHKRHRIRCSEGSKVADPKSIFHYYVCYKGQDGRMNGHKLTCSSGLMFCSRTSMCTLPRRCKE